MKRLVWILLLLNVLVFAYFKVSDFAPAPSTLKPELHPELMKLLTKQSLNDYPQRTSAPHASESLSALAEHAENSNETQQQTPADSVNPDSSKPDVDKPSVEKAPLEKPVVAKPETSKMEPRLAEKPEPKSNAHSALTHACYEWGSFNLAKINEAVDVANQLGIKHFVNQQSGAVENTRFWIYKPPLASAEAAQTKADELRKLGVEDFFIVQDPKWRNAISFGVFRDEQLADKLMADLKAKGVRLLIKSTRYGGQGQAVVKLQDVTPQQFANLKKTQPQFPDSVLKEMVCP